MRWLPLLPGDAFVGLDVPGPRRFHDLRRAPPARAGSCPSRCRAPSRAGTACRRRTAGRPAASRSAGQNRDESEVSTSSPRVSTPSAAQPNSSLVSATMMPRSAAISAPRAVDLQGELAAAPRRRSAPSCATTWSKVMNSSWVPSGALVVGVKIGSGSRDPSTSPAGRGTPEIDPSRWYSFSPLPGEVAAGDALDRDHLQPAAADGTAGELRGHVGGGDHVVGHDVGELLEPPQRQLGEHLALVRDGCGQDHVEDRHPVGRDQDQVPPSA